MYVWFEAVIGYVSSTREWAIREGDPDKWKDYWFNPDCTLVHFLGKDNIVFHAILWPAMLMAHGDFILPTYVPANEFLNIEGQKLSTSRNWAIWLDEFLTAYPPDPLRYYLASVAPETKDSDFAWKDLQSRNNNELADIFGNFINRCLTFIVRYFDGVTPSPGALTEEDTVLLNGLASAPKTVGASFETFQVRAAIRELITVGNQLNKYFNDQGPWLTRKSDPARCQTTMWVCAQAVRSLAILLSPIIPFSSERIWQMLNLEGSPHHEAWDEAGQPGVPEGHRIGKPEILFTKIEDETVEQESAKLGKPTGGALFETAPGEPVKHATQAAPLSIEDFQRIELRVADIIAAERVPKADKLLRLQIRIGDEERQIVAGIAKQYDPADLPGQQIVVVANLQPTVIRGVESQGMLLAATNADGLPILIRPHEAVPSGVKVK